MRSGPIRGRGRKEVETITINGTQARPYYLKYLNKKKVLRYIQNVEGQSRATISKALKISKPTVSNLVDELLKEGWVTERESTFASSSGGRKPYRIYFNRNAKYIVGVDIGGTSTDIAVTNLEGELVSLTQFATQPCLQNDLIQTLTAKILNMLERNGIPHDKIMAVGVGVPGITDVEEGVVFEAPSLGWKNYALREKLSRQLPFPVYVDNDVNVAVLGEQWKGVAKNKQNVILITLGTGVGCGIILNGQLFRGSSYAAGEIGYMITDKNKAEQAYDPIFSGYGFLESHVGGPSIVKKMMLKLPSTERSVNETEWTAKKVFQEAMKGNTVALEVVDEAISHIAFALVNVISLFNPECVVLGGGISKSGHWFLPKVRKVIEKHLPLQTEVLVTELEHVSLIGAASLCLREHESLFKLD